MATMDPANNYKRKAQEVTLQHKPPDLELARRFLSSIHWVQVLIHLLCMFISFRAPSPHVLQLKG